MTILPTKKKVIGKQWSDNFNDNHLLTRGQYGFRSQHLTEYAAVEIIDRAKQPWTKMSVPYMYTSTCPRRFDHDILPEQFKCN